MDKNLKNPLIQFNRVPKIIAVTLIILHDIGTWFDNYVSISRFPTIFLKKEKKKERKKIFKAILRRTHLIFSKYFRTFAAIFGHAIQRESNKTSSET